MKSLIVAFFASVLALGATTAAFAVDQTTSNIGPGASADSNGYADHHGR